MDTVKIGIIGTGWIAEKMAITLEGMEGVEAYAVASRQLQTACDFADRWGFTRAYGSYEEMLDDEEVELVYIATPHSHHFEHARMSLLKGKAVLCEKAFTANARQAEELLNLAKEKELFITEAIWTRYMPLSQTINDLVNGGIIGRPMTLSANLGYPIGNRAPPPTGTGRRGSARPGSVCTELCFHGFRDGRRACHLYLRKDRYRSRCTE